MKTLKAKALPRVMKCGQCGKHIRCAHLKNFPRAMRRHRASAHPNHDGEIRYTRVSEDDTTR